MCDNLIALAKTLLNSCLYIFIKLVELQLNVVEKIREVETKKCLEFDFVYLSC